MRRSKRKRDVGAWLWLFAMAALMKGSSSVTPPSNTPTTPPSGQPFTLQQLRELAASLGFADPQTAAAIAMAESRGYPGAKNISAIERSFGLWQINTRAHPEFDEVQLLDPTYNARAALVVSQGGTSWTPWSTFINGAYKQFMGGAA